MVLIELTGHDGSGKSTVLSQFTDKADYFTAHFPYKNVPSGALIYAEFQKPKPNRAYMHQLMDINRQEFWDKYGNTLNDKVLLFDRYITERKIYRQLDGHDDGRPFASFGIPLPDLTIELYCPSFQTLLDRRPKAVDPYEASIFERSYKLYESIRRFNMASEYFAGTQKAHVCNASLTPTVLHVLQLVRDAQRSKYARSKKNPK